MELLLVLVILGTLAAIVVPKFAGRTEQAGHGAQPRSRTSGLFSMPSKLITATIRRERTGFWTWCSSRETRSIGAALLKNEIPNDPWGNLTSMNAPAQ